MPLKKLQHCLLNYEKKSLIVGIKFDFDVK